MTAAVRVPVEVNIDLTGLAGPLSVLFYGAVVVLIVWWIRRRKRGGG